MKLVLVRHVETFGNVERRLNGHTESEYTDKGEKMKEILVKYLVELDQKFNFDSIFSSPISRAYKIAESVGSELSKDVTVDERLKEFNFGIFEGKTRDESIRDHQSEWDAWMDNYLDYQVPKGQSQREYQNLCRAFLDELEAEKTHLIVAHGGTIHSLVTNLMELPIESKWHFDIKLGSITTLNVFDGFAQLTHMGTPPYDELIVEVKDVSDDI
ncbi:histidine phosphatase family protein [Eubacteriaceae bacterium ES3]|nr:histidine phosphatase family protein [Eubacteriaceae bacterium ES3]